MKFYKWIIDLKDHLIFLILLFLSLLVFLFRGSPSSIYIQSQIFSVSSYLGTPLNLYNQYLLTNSKNKQFSKQLITKNLELSRLKKIKNENIKLKKLLNYKSNFDKELLLSRAIDIDQLKGSNLIQINLGYKDSIKLNSSILDDQGLLGKIVYVDKNKSLAQLIYDKNFHVSVAVGDGMALGLFSPSNKFYGVVKGVISSAEINKGDLVYTSGYSDIFPANIPVAEVERVYTNEITSIRNISVKILGEVNNISYVFIASKD